MLSRLGNTVSEGRFCLQQASRRYKVCIGVDSYCLDVGYDGLRNFCSPSTRLWSFICNNQSTSNYIMSENQSIYIYTQELDIEC